MNEELLGRVAASRGVSAEWLRLIAEGSLDDRAFVVAAREAAKEPILWELVSPAAKNQLLVPTAKVQALGGTLNDLFAMLGDMIETLAHPRNRNLGSKPGAALQL